MKKLKSEETTIASITPSSDEDVDVIGRQRESRIGKDFQVDCNYIPNPTSKPSMLPEEYLDRSKAKAENDYSIYELVWDPNAAKGKGVEEFIEMYVPSSHKEFALEALHKRNYNIDGFMEDLEETTPLDGSDWSFREKTLFRELMLETKHDLQEVAEKMGKSFGNCLVVFYKTMANVQSERSKRSRRKNNDYSSLSDGGGFDFKSPSLLKKSKHYSSRKRSRKSEIITADQEDESRTSLELSDAFVQGSRKNDDTSAKSCEKSLKFDHENETSTHEKKKSQASISTMSPSKNPPSTMNDGDSSKCLDTRVSNEKCTEISGQNDLDMTLEKTQEDVNDDVLVTPSTRPSINTIAFKPETNQECLLTINAAQNDNEESKGSSGTLKTAEIDAPLSSNQSSTKSSKYCNSTDKQSPHVSSNMDTNNNENLENQPTSIQDNVLEKNDNENAKCDLNTLESSTAENSKDNNDDNVQSQLKNLTQSEIETKSCDVDDPNIKTDMEVHSVDIPDDDDQSGKGDKGENESVSRRRSPSHQYGDNVQSQLKNLTQSEIETKSCDVDDPNIKTDMEVHSVDIPDDDDQSGRGDKGENESVSRRKFPRHLHTSKDASFDQINSTDKNTTTTLSYATATTQQQRYPRRSTVEYNLKEDDANRSLRKTRSHVKACAKEELDEESLSAQKRYPRRSKRKCTDTDEGTFAKIKKQNIKHEKSTGSRSRRSGSRKLSATFDSISRGKQSREFRRNQRQSKLAANDRIHKLSSPSGEHPHENREAKERKRRSVVKVENKDSAQKETKALQKVTTRREDLARPKTNNTPEFEESFDVRLAELKEFYEKNGHGLVPKVYENKKLSYWVFRLRSMEKNRKAFKNRLTPWHKKVLKKYGFEFQARAKSFQFQRERKKEEREIAFNQKFERLVKFKKSHGHCIVPKLYPPDQSLSYWVFKSRQYRIAQETRGAQEMISKEQIKRLDSIGFVWAAKKNPTWKKSERIRLKAMWDESWEKAYKKLLQFKKKHGHTQIPKTWPQDQHLASWCFRQKMLYRMDQDLDDGDGQILNLPKHRKEKLEKIGFNFHSKRRSPQKHIEIDSGDESCEPFDSGKNIGFSRNLRSNRNGYNKEVGERKRKIIGRITRTSLSAATASSDKGASDAKASSQIRTNKRKKKNYVKRQKEGLGRKRKSMSPSHTSKGSKNEENEESEDEDVIENPEKKVRMTRNSLSTLAHSPIASADERSDSNYEESEDEDVIENPEKKVRMTRNSLSTLAHSPIASADERSDSNYEESEESEDEDVTENPEKKVRMTRNSLSTLAYSLFQASKSFLEK